MYPVSFFVSSLHFSWQSRTCISLSKNLSYRFTCVIDLSKKCRIYSPLRVRRLLYLCSSLCFACCFFNFIAACFLLYSASLCFCTSNILAIFTLLSSSEYFSIKRLQVSLRYETIQFLGKIEVCHLLGAYNIFRQ